MMTMSKQKIVILKSNLVRIIVICAAMIMSTSLLAEEDIAYSEAQLLLFSRPHLEKIKKPIRLDYEFHHLGQQEIHDSISSVITHVNEQGLKDIEFKFLSGDQQIDYPAVDSFSANPLIMLVMEWDVNQMDRDMDLSVGKGFLRNQLRIGFWKHCTVSDINVDYQGRQIQAKHIVMQPFAKNSRLQMLAKKHYEFFMSEEIPGEIFKIHIHSENNGSVERTEMLFKQTSEY